MPKATTFHTRIAYWFLLLIPLVFFGFYPTYFAILSRPTPFIIHLHFVLMMVWVGILITQPFLYRKKKLALHRLIGKASYIVVPLLLITAYFMLRFSYFRTIGGMEQQVMTGQLQLDRWQILQQAASYLAIAFLYFGWLAIFYTMAVINRRKTSAHARFMIAAALTMLGPTIDRIIYWIFKTDKLGGIVPIESVAFLVADTILLIILINDKRHGRPLKPVLGAFLIFITGQLLYFLLKNTDPWARLVKLLMGTS